MVSVILPAHNEQGKIELALCRVLASIPWDSEVIVVDDGSTDDTFGTVKRFALTDPRIRAVRNETNMGKGFAVRTGAKLSLGEKVIVLDADMEIDPAQLRMYLRLLDSSDVCIASKRHPYSVYQAPLRRKLLSVTFNKIVRLMTGLNVGDTQTGLKAIRGDEFRTIMDVILVKRFAYDVEMLIVAQLMGLRMVEVPVHIQQDSRFGLKPVMFMLVDLAGIAYRVRLLKWYERRLASRELTYKPIIPL